MTVTFPLWKHRRMAANDPSDRALIAAIGAAKRWHGDTADSMVAEVATRRLVRAVSSAPPLTRDQFRRVAAAIPRRAGKPDRSP